MARGKSTASFTEPGHNRSSAFPLAWPLSKVPEAVLRDIAAGLNVKPTARDIEAALVDPAGLRARLASAPLLSVVVLEILADFGGGAPLSIVVDELMRRTGVQRSDATEAVKVAHQSFALISLSSNAPGRSSASDQPRSLALLDICAASVAACVRGLTLPHPAPPADALATPSRSARDLIAVAGLTAHRTLKLTQGGWPNKASLKSMFKETGLDINRGERLLLSALRCGLVNESDPARVQAAALVRFAVEPDRADEAAREAWLPRGRWVSLEAAQRALSARAYSHGDLSINAWFLGGQLVQGMSYWMELIQLSPWLDVLEHGGATWLRRRAIAASTSPSSAGSGDGYITPSFEVMLGPAAASDIVAQVTLGCELVRVDHMLTFRIGPRSVEAGLAAGMDGERFLGALARVGPRGVPDNVRIMVEDWLQSARLAHLERGVIVRVAERFGDAVASALGPDVLGRIGRGVLVVRVSPNGPDVRQRLVKLGYRLSSDAGALWSPGPLDVRSAPDALDAVSSFPPPRAPLLTLWPEPDAKLAERFDAAKINGFLDDIRRLSRPQAPLERDRSQRPEATAGEALREPEGALAKAEAAAALAAQMFTTYRAELNAWMARLREEERARARQTLDYPLFWAPLMVLLPKYRTRVLSRERTLDDAILDAWRLCGAARRHREGSALMSLIRDAHLNQDAWYEALDALDDPDDGAATLGELFGPPRPSPAAATKPAAHSAISPSTSARGASTSASSSGSMSPEEILARVERARSENRSIVLRVAEENGVSEEPVRVVGVRTLGRETWVLVTDVATDVGRAIPITQIRGATLQANVVE